MNINKAVRRDSKWRKRKYGQTRDGDSVFLIQEQIEKKRREILKKKEKKLRESILSDDDQ